MQTWCCHHRTALRTATQEEHPCIGHVLIAQFHFGSGLPPLEALVLKSVSVLSCTDLPNLAYQCFTENLLFQQNWVFFVG